jgi:hypothetical protein
MIETLSFEIALWSDFWDQPPTARIKVNDQVFFENTIIGDRGTNNYLIKFSADLDCGSKHCLQIERGGKNDTQCVVVDGGYKDQMLHIKQVKIDGIDIQNLVWHRSWFEPQYPEPWASQQQQKGVILESSVLGETWLGHNGTWFFEFHSPFYQFLISQFR